MKNHKLQILQSFIRQTYSPLLQQGLDLCYFIQSVSQNAARNPKR